MVEDKKEGEVRAKGGLCAAREKVSWKVKEDSTVVRSLGTWARHDARGGDRTGHQAPPGRVLRTWQARHLGTLGLRWG